MTRWVDGLWGRMEGSLPVRYLGEFRHWMWGLDLGKELFFANKIFRSSPVNVQDGLRTAETMSEP